MCSDLEELLIKYLEGEGEKVDHLLYLVLYKMNKKWKMLIDSHSTKYFICCFIEEFLNCMFAIKLI